jgi:hypothetical protein
VADATPAAPAPAAPARPVRAAVRIAVIYVAARLITTLFLFLAAELSGFGSRMGPDANLASTIVAWDGTWYWLIGYSGYPSTLPLTDAGQIAENAWAFLPIYPYLSWAH